MIEDDGAHPLDPGDAACRACRPAGAAGAANAHQVVNRSDARCTYLIFGTRTAREVIHYPDIGRVGYVEGEVWWLHRTDDGTWIMEGRTGQARRLTWWGSEADRVPQHQPIRDATAATHPDDFPHQPSGL